MSSLPLEDFRFITELLKKRSGIDITEDKIYLIESRLLPVIRKHSIATISALVTALKVKMDEAIILEIIEAMTTNETSFFRDTKPFTNLVDPVIPHILKASKSDIRIWSAACSSGQEAYSIAMTLLEKPALLGTQKFSIEGTDIDRTIIQKANSGRFTQFEVQRGLPITHLIKYFNQVEEEWEAKPDFKKHASFSFRNLIEPFSGFGPFDIVFCRNVLIYFDSPTKTKILDNIASVLKPHGVLFLGSAENATQFSKLYKAFGDLKGVYLLNK
ncbi:MAG: methyltransferase domain-containing protein [Alphaproteobacteria bacterium]|nr:methyltransferase domain-containing protein [Alphaproteobacteria bacterium]